MPYWVKVIYCLKVYLSKFSFIFSIIPSHYNCHPTNPQRLVHSFWLTRPRAGLRPAGPRWIVGRVQFSWVTSHEYTSHPLLRAFGTQLGGDILCQNICSQFGPNFRFLDFSNVYFLEANLNFFDGKPGLTECHGDPLWWKTGTNGVPRGPSLMENRD